MPLDSGSPLRDLRNDAGVLFQTETCLLLAAILFNTNVEAAPKKLGMSFREPLSQRRKVFHRESEPGL